MRIEETKMLVNGEVMTISRFTVFMHHFTPSDGNQFHGSVSFAKDSIVITRDFEGKAIDGVIKEMKDYLIKVAIDV